MNTVDVTRGFPEFPEQHLGWTIQMYTVLLNMGKTQQYMVYAMIVDPEGGKHIKIGRKYTGDNFEEMANMVVKEAIQKFYDNQEKGIVGPIIE